MDLARGSDGRRHSAYHRRWLGARKVQPVLGLETAGLKMARSECRRGERGRGRRKDVRPSGTACKRVTCQLLPRCSGCESGGSVCRNDEIQFRISRGGGKRVKTVPYVMVRVCRDSQLLRLDLRQKYTTGTPAKRATTTHRANDQLRGSHFFMPNTLCSPFDAVLGFGHLRRAKDLLTSLCLRLRWTLSPATGCSSEDAPNDAERDDRLLLLLQLPCSESGGRPRLAR